MTSVAVLGTGLLGTAIATRLLEQGLKVHVWNRDRSRIVSLVEKGATAIDDLGQAAKNNSILITVLRDGAATASVISTVGALSGSTVVPMGTMGVDESRKLATQVADQGGRYLEAPVLGSKPQALNGSLLVMAGVPVETFMAILRPSALYAPTFDKKLQRMLDHSYADPNFSTALLRKDLRLFLEEATTEGLQDQGLSGLLSLLEQAKGTDLDEQDYCALHELTVLR